MESKRKFICKSINDLVNIIIFSDTSTLLRDDTLDITISDTPFYSTYPPSLPEPAAYMLISWSNSNYVQNIVNCFLKYEELHQNWVNYFKANSILVKAHFDFISALSHEISYMRNVTLSERSAIVNESQEKYSLNDSELQIIFPPYFLDSHVSSFADIYNLVKSVLHIHTISYPKWNYSVQLSVQSEPRSHWLQTRSHYPYTYHPYGKKFTNDMNAFSALRSTNTTTSNAKGQHILNYKRLTKSTPLCLSNCTNEDYRWKLLYLACLHPQKTIKEKMDPTDFKDIHFIVLGPSNSVLFAGGQVPIIPVKNWANWAKFKLNPIISNDSTAIRSCLRFELNKSFNTDTVNQYSLIIIINFELIEENDLMPIEKFDKFIWLKQNFIQLLENNNVYIANSTDCLLEKFLKVEIVPDLEKINEIDNLMKEMCISVHKILVRSKNKEIHDEYKTILGKDNFDGGEEFLYIKMQEYVKHLQDIHKLEKSKKINKSSKKDDSKRKRVKKCDQAFDDLSEGMNAIEYEKNNYDNYENLVSVDFDSVNFELTPVTNLINFDKIEDRQVKHDNDENDHDFDELDFSPDVNTSLNQTGDIVVKNESIIEKTQLINDFNQIKSLETTPSSDHITPNKEFVFAASQNFEDFNDLSQQSQFSTLLNYTTTPNIPTLLSTITPTPNIPTLLSTITPTPPIPTPTSTPTFLTTTSNNNNNNNNDTDDDDSNPNSLTVKTLLSFDNQIPISTPLMANASRMNECLNENSVLTSAQIRNSQALYHSDCSDNLNDDFDDFENENWSDDEDYDNNNNNNNDENNNDDDDDDDSNFGLLNIQSNRIEGFSPQKAILSYEDNDAFDDFDNLANEL